MNERFVFIPSLGFTLILGYWLYLLSISKNDAVKKLSVALLALVGVLYGAKTFTRNFVWKDDFTLFLTDVKTSDNSIKCNISAGGSELQIWKKSHKERDKVAAYRYLEKALELDDHAFNAYLLLGELCYLDGNISTAYQAYQNAVLIDPESKLAQDNLAKMTLAAEDEQISPINKLLDEGMAEQNPAKIQEAYRQITEYLEQHPESLIALNIKGNVVGRGMGRLDEAIGIYEQVLAKDSTFASSWENMGIAYAIQQKFDKAQECLEKALKLSPDNDNIKYMQQIKTDSTVQFQHIVPSEYIVKIIHDRNENGQWDTGKYIEQAYPERTIKHPKKQVVKSKWNTEADWRL